MPVTLVKLSLQKTNTKRQDGKSSMNRFNARRAITILFTQPRGTRANRLRFLLFPIIFSTGLFACSNLKDAQSLGPSTTSAARTYIEDKKAEDSPDRDIEAYQWFY